MTLIPIADLFKEAERLETSGNGNLVPELYKSWIALNPNDGLQHAAYFNYSVALSRQGDRAGAINALRACIRLKPDFYPPYLNLGRLLEDSGQTGAAVGQWLELVKTLAGVNGDAVRNKLLVLQQTGRVLENAHCDAPAEDALRQALDLNLDQPEAVQHWIALRQRQCKWPVLEGWDGVPAKKLFANISPLSAAIMVDDPMFQLARGHRYARDTVGIPETVIAPPVRPREGRKLRIGYVSSDLREHAVGFGLAEVMELHDRQRYEIHAYYCGISRTDPTQARIQANVDAWTDINQLNDDAAAERIATDGIDILIDLNGFTRDARTAVFARRPAPVIANWFGFPGTMGTPYHNYIIADPVVIPEGDEIFYSEKVLRLECYQPNDRRRPVAERIPTRAEEGLPEDAFVYCCLNGSQKITPAVFGLWMQILHRVPKSVLWLLTSSPDINARLRQMAERHGIAGSRLVFAEKKPNPLHLARYRLADLFVDTHPYGAHTTAADALWMGVPMVTIPGASFASRVCADVVQAAGLPELVCATPGDYVARAVELGLDRGKAAALSRSLLASRTTSLLFDTTRLVRRLESLFDEMWADAEAGRIPVPDLTNLEVYSEIGTELCLAPGDGLAPGASPERYRERLRVWNRVYPLKADGRLWDGGQR
jgi:predicted O-linked N-acetylglucosamine transferase (SPINDLY family)